MGCRGQTRGVELAVARAIVAGLLLFALGLAGLQLDVSPVKADSYPVIVPQEQFVTGNQDEELTADPSPSFLIESTTAGTFQCTLDSKPQKLCGAAPASCPETACTVYSPGIMHEGEHYLEVRDSSGSGADLDFDVDATPPQVASGVLVSSTELDDPRPFRPTFDFDVRDDDEYARDVVQCSLVKTPAPPNWSHCSAAHRFSFALPHIRAHYTIGIRALDAFGRSSTPVLVSYDPMPCTVDAIARPTGLNLELHGMNLNASCVGVPRIRIDLYLLGFGHYRVPAGQIGSAIGETTVHATGHRQKVHIRLQVGPTTDQYIKEYRTVYLRLVERPMASRVTTSANALGAPVKTDFTIVNPKSHYEVRRLQGITVPAGVRSRRRRSS